MKRKHGHKKGKQKKPCTADGDEPHLNVSSSSEHDSSGKDDFGNVDEYDSGMEVDTPSSTAADQPEKIRNVNSDGSLDKTAGRFVYGRVKVKLKTSKATESQLTSSDAPTQSDTDKGSRQVALEKQVGVTEKEEDIANSINEIKASVLENTSKRSGSIKIKSSRGLAAATKNQTTDGFHGGSEKPRNREPNIPPQDFRYNKQELEDALMVIKKVMKMEAAEPFNIPVNPIALGIPDYFDVIDTPMDFGTICSNLENGIKYTNSEDVYKDVQYIWNNCYKYNNRGDYIVDLMKRVKKNFTKYWTAAGLYSEQLQRNTGGESNEARDATPSNLGRFHAKQKKGKRHGFKRHKDGCLCAICILKRRRREREQNAKMHEEQIRTPNTSLAPEFNQEDTSPVESPCEDTSSNIGVSVDLDSDGAVEEKGDELKSETGGQLFSLQEEEEKEDEGETQKQGEDENPEPPQLGSVPGGENSGRPQIQESCPAIGVRVDDVQKEETLAEGEHEATTGQQQKLKELQDKCIKPKVYENLCGENAVFLELCGALFPDDRMSVWNGPRSLVPQRRPPRGGGIRAAIESLVK